MAIIETHGETAPKLDDDLSGRVAFVTGGTRGIGAAISRRLAARGATVVAGFAHDEASAARFTADCAWTEVPISVHRSDISSPDECRRSVQEVLDRCGRLDILVNNAGITADRITLRMSDDDWHRVLAVNLSGAFFTAQAALPHMLEQAAGRIVNISSIIGQTGNVGQVNYAASKSGLFGLTMSLAKEAAFMLKRAERLDPDGRNVTVNAVAPGFVETDMLATVPGKVLDGIRAQVPLNRLGRPEEVARAVEFLVSDASAYITGQVIAVNGGMEM
ncbi:3-oxoacyl-[acyl-carrier-protein] reductase [Solirubrobacter pauli]|uniref:3-oxoacyl-[acyl-carrier-protein] reductase n=1 Tax=Solirubrobacter pauli TaxID=166793 RepID=A0A660L1N5_9ACTN|nr:3-oxoacyl-ACP reductase family protein [Solirubrobacter pauli]RKQ86839.1 3-oxoacyl-[acyl-carrier-protein] reductase [Solirubrobacter pauli]